MHIDLDRIYLPVATLGPGKRIAIWTAGCSKRCPGCANPELWQADAAKRLPVDAAASVLVQASQRSGIRRITFTGGDPLEQPAALACMLERIRPHFDDILVYTGYALEDLRAFADGERNALPGIEAETPEETLRQRGAVSRALSLADALIDGRYIEALNDGVCALRGSTNQRVHVLAPELRADYERALSEARRVQNALMPDGRSLSVGIHSRPRATA